ncbi:MAG: hypothetical protein ACLUSP_04125 [Christensenellales bacterium]
MNKFTVLYNPLAGKTDKAAIKPNFPRFYPTTNSNTSFSATAKVTPTCLKTSPQIVKSCSRAATERLTDSSTTPLPIRTRAKSGTTLRATATISGRISAGKRRRSRRRYRVSQNLPLVTVNGVTRKFINGIGYGIDGYCCEVGDKMRAEGKQNINYAGIAIKGLLFFFKRANAVVTVDGKEKSYKKYGSRLR